MQRRLFQEATLLVALVLLVAFSVWRNPAFSSRENWQSSPAKPPSSASSASAKPSLS